MAEGTITVINTTNIDLSSDLGTDGKFTSSALTLSSDFVDLEIAWTGVTGDYPVITIEGSNGGTTYTELLMPEENYFIPVKYVIKETAGDDRLAVDGLNTKYAKVVVWAPDATAGTITITANH